MAFESLNGLNSLVAAALGAAGGTIYRLTLSSSSPIGGGLGGAAGGGGAAAGSGTGAPSPPGSATAEKWWQSLLIGVVAAVGLLVFVEPTSDVELVGVSLLAGFFGHSLLSAIQSRLLIRVTQQQASNAMEVASEAIDLSHRTVPDDGPRATAHEVTKLRERLDKVRRAHR